MGDPLVRTDIDDGVAVITLDDPGRRNALGYGLSSALANAVHEAEAAAVGAIVLTATPPVFCAGGSLDDLLEPKVALRETYVGYLAVARAAVPTIAAVNGPCVGAGVNLPLACDVVLCSAAARFDPRFLDVGIAPGGGHLWRLARRVGRQGAAAMTLCGDVLDGPEAERVGLAWRCVEEDALLDAAMGLARRAAERPRVLMTKTKAMLAQTVDLTTVDEAFEAELGLQDWSMHQPEFTERVEALRARTSSKR
jgi:enoyl-CoA hydratase